jgi:carbon storage regulator
MLVLSRKEGERLVIGDRIIVTVVHVEGGRVKLGVEAPREVGIWREELQVHPSGGAAHSGREHAGESPLFAECW